MTDRRVPGEDGTDGLGVMIKATDLATRCGGEERETN